ncbi:MAG: hypothetical protein QME96_06455, partial [Myxococcota bacterium]|nr:hypothetical protein [Myxococcota bacterium]
MNRSMAPPASTEDGRPSRARRQTRRLGRLFQNNGSAFERKVASQKVVAMRSSRSSLVVDPMASA